MVPYIGDDVIVLGLPSNGSRTHPGKLTRIWSSDDLTHGALLVNVVVFPDNHPPVSKTTIKLFATEAEALAATAAPGSQVACYLRPCRCSCHG